MSHKLFDERREVRIRVYTPPASFDMDRSVGESIHATHLTQDGRVIVIFARVPVEV